ncbi:LysR family transcriptional regulator [Saccharopolyspora sp. 5N102]|uniref:LysR family transcriptional regulator n=1 Tax=Saccharopolyspora sp. 5N102 TaxID=3375155 RepID=UPI0037B2D3B4
MVEIRVLRYFLAVVDQGSITAAARDVRIAQPSISRQLRNLERSLGVELFARTPGPRKLTFAGERFLPLARDLVARADRTMGAVRAMTQGHDVPLTVAAPPTTIADFLAPYLADRGAASSIRDILERDARSVYDVVARGDADLGVAPIPPPGSMESRIVGHAPVLALVPPTHPLARIGEVELTELVQEQLILMHPVNAGRLALDAAAAREGLVYNEPRVVSTTVVARALAASGHGIAVLTDKAIFGLTPVAIRVGESLLSVTLYAGWDRSHWAGAQVTALVDSVSRFHREVLARIRLFESAPGDCSE